MLKISLTSFKIGSYIFFAIFTLFFITFFSYYSALNNGFVWDDVPYVVRNSYITQLNWDNMQWMFTQFYMSNWHPLTWLSLAVDYQMFGNDPWGYHLTNIIFHLLNVFLVLILTIIVISLHKNSSEELFFTAFKNRKYLLSGWIAALLFGIHPQHVESVAWIAERKDVLSMFFTLMALLAYTTYAKCSSYCKIYYGLGLVFCALAMMAKPMAVTIPAVLLLLDIYPLQRTRLTLPARDARIIQWKFLLLEKLPFFLLSSGVIVLTLLAQNQAIVDLSQRDMALRWLNAANSITLYISKFFVPVNLQPFYIYTPKPGDFNAYIPLLACLAITAVAIYYWISKKSYYLLAAWTFYLVTLSPVIGIIQVGLQSSADRYAYFPTLPFYIVIGGLVSHSLFIIPSKPIFKAFRFFYLLILFGILSALIIKTEEQISIWKNDQVFWNYIVHLNPENGRAQANLGRIEYAFENYEKAMKHFEIANAHNALLLQDMLLWSQACIKTGKLQSALQIYSAALTMPDLDNPRKSCVYYNIACIHLLNGNSLVAQDFFNLVQSIDPDYQNLKKAIPQFDRKSDILLCQQPCFK